jgi:hypothetical protein
MILLCTSVSSLCVPPPITDRMHITSSVLVREAVNALAELPLRALIRSPAAARSLVARFAFTMMNVVSQFRQ